MSDQEFHDSEYATAGKQAQHPAAADAIHDTVVATTAERYIGWLSVMSDEHRARALQVIREDCRRYISAVTGPEESATGPHFGNLYAMVSSLAAVLLQELAKSPPPMIEMKEGGEIRADFDSLTTWTQASHAFQIVSGDLATNVELAKFRELLALPGDQVRDVYEHGGDPVTLVRWPNPEDDAGSWHLVHGDAETAHAQTWCQIGYANDAALEVEHWATSTGRLDREAVQVCYSCQVRFHDGRTPE